MMFDSACRIGLATTRMIEATGDGLTSFMQPQQASPVEKLA
jgi:hypothetical protein